MQYLRLLHSCLTLFNLQNEAALLRNKTTQSQSYYILFCGVKWYLNPVHEASSFCSSYFIRCRTAPKAGENSLFLLAELEGWFCMLSQNCSFPLIRSKSLQVSARPLVLRSGPFVLRTFCTPDLLYSWPFEGGPFQAGRFVGVLLFWGL